MLAGPTAALERFNLAPHDFEARVQIFRVGIVPFANAETPSHLLGLVDGDRQFGKPSPALSRSDLTKAASRWIDCSTA